MTLSFKKTTVGALLAVPLIFAVSATPAFAINSVNCGSRTDFLKVNYSIGGGSLGAAKCFANAGVTAADISRVTSFSSGNNKVTVNYEYGGRYYSRTVGKWITEGYAQVRIYEVRIY